MTTQEHLAAIRDQWLRMVELRRKQLERVGHLAMQDAAAEEEVEDVEITYCLALVELARAEAALTTR